MVVSTDSDTNFKWEYCLAKDGYTLYQAGSHRNGDFIQLLVPEHPCDKQGKLKLITYLHGFALCMPLFYEQHLARLAKQGYYVLFPDFQRSTYPNDPETKDSSPDKVQKAPLRFWLDILTATIAQRDRSEVEDTFNQQPKEGSKVRSLARKLIAPTLFEYFRLSLAFVVLILFIRLLNRRYGKHLIKLMSTVALSLLHGPSEWLQQAIQVTDTAWSKFCQDNELAQSEFDFYVFGHSLGGLLALSWPFYIEKAQQEHLQKFLPKQIITADPAPSTEMGIPKIIKPILQLLQIPFVTQALNISKTGASLSDIPVAIMHGADDKIVKPKLWIKPPLFKKTTNFDYIASQHKKIYFSLSNRQNHPPLVAFHNQAVTDTGYFSKDLFKNFGGVKEAPNAYNCEYIYPGLRLVVDGDVRADELLPKFPLEKIKVTDKLEIKSNLLKIVTMLAIILALLSLGYWLWHSGIVLNFS